MEGVKMLTGACICAVIWLCMLRSSCCEPLPMAAEVSAPRTGRNKPFGSPDELRSYLDELNQYFAVVGRPRFGKRSSLEEINQYYARASVPRFGKRTNFDELNQYLALASRPRFGKRLMVPLPTGPLNREPANQTTRTEAEFTPLTNSEVYRLFYAPENDVS